MLRKFGEEPQPVAHFLIRLLFCLFAEDIGLLPEKLFPRLLEQTRRNSKQFADVLQQLFRAMNTGGFFGADKILHFNGGLFDDDSVLPLDSDAMDIIGDIDGLDWGAIKPSIFGTLFERGLDPAKRSQLGAHYTSEDDILLIVEPVLMAPLRREWETIKDEVRSMKDEEGKAKDRKKRDAQKKIKNTLLAFADRIASIKVLDPACGSANFLYVALRLLLDLQNEVLNFSDEMGAGRPYITVTPAQLYGIETNEYAHELAQMTIQIGYIQWLRDNGYGSPAEPILKQTKNILKMDAILQQPEKVTVTSEVTVTSPREPEWPPVDVIIGNPPFLGDRKMRRELSDKYVDEIRKLYGDRLPGGSDLVCYWFEKARAMIEQKKCKRAGLLATQGIRGGLNRAVLDRIKASGNIFWAESDRAWILDGAVVHVSMIGFDDGTETNYFLDGKSVTSINSDLSSSFDLTLAKELSENARISFIGTQKSGPFDLTEKQAKEMLAIQGNPNNRPNSDVVKPWINAIDVTQSPRNMWVIDFGPNLAIEEASKYDAPFEYVKAHVKPIRDRVRREAHKKKWWLFGDTRPGMRVALKSLSRYIATPMVSKHRVFVWKSTSVIPENLLVVIARNDDYFFGVLHSKLHELWARRKGSQLREAESGSRYTPTSTFETFPFPWAPSKEPKNDPRVRAISQAAKELVEQRDRWLKPESQVTVTLKVTVTSDEPKAAKKRTLTNLYNQRPTWLDLAHKKLDEAVFAAYGWKSDLTDEEILEKLLALNLERSKPKKK